MQILLLQQTTFVMNSFRIEQGYWMSQDFKTAHTEVSMTMLHREPVDKLPRFWRTAVISDIWLGITLWQIETFNCLFYVCVTLFCSFLSNLGYIDRTPLYKCEKCYCVQLLHSSYHTKSVSQCLEMHSIPVRVGYSSVIHGKVWGDTQPLLHS